MVFENSIEKRLLSDGSITATWNSPGVIESAEVSRDGRVAVAYAGGELFALDDSLSKLGSTSIRLSSLSLSLHPQGKHVLLNSDQGPARWSLTGLYQQKTFLNTGRYKPDTAITVAGKKADVWIDPSWVNVFEGNQLLNSEQFQDVDGANVSVPTPMFANIVDITACDYDQENDWQLAVGENRSGTEFFLIDCAFQSAEFAVKQSLDERPLSVSASDDGKTVAVETASEWSIYVRMTWPDPHSKWTSESLAKKLISSSGFRREQTDLAMDFILATKGLFRNAFTENDMHYRFSRYLGNQWAELETDPVANEKVLSELENWADGASINASLVNCARHLQAAYLFEVAKPRRVQEAFERWQKGYECIQRCIATGFDLPAAAYTYWVALSHLTDQPYESVEPALIEYVARFPNEYYAHLRTCWWMIYEDNYESADAVSYARQLMEVYPPRIREMMFVRIAAGLELMSDFRAVSVDFNNVEDLQIGLETLLELGVRDPKYLYGVVYFRDFETSKGNASIKPKNDPIRLRILRHLVGHEISIPWQYFGCVHPNEFLELLDSRL